MRASQRASFALSLVNNKGSSIITSSLVAETSPSTSP
jgi:hypothetical protein